MKKNHINLAKIISFWVLVFLVGGIAGVIFSQILLPRVADFWPFNAVGLFNNIKDGVTIINKTEKITITENTAYQEAIDKVVNSLVVARVERGGKKIIESPAFILTGDGLLAAGGIVVPKAAEQIYVFISGKDYEAKLIKRDEKNNLVLIKIDETNLSVTDLGDAADLKLGETVFLVWAEQLNGSLNKLVNLGFVRGLAPEISLTFSESQSANGGLVANLKGEVLGLASIDKDGKIKIISEDKIKDLLK